MAVIVTVFVPVVDTLVVVSGTYPTKSIHMMYHGAPAAATAMPPAVRKCLVAVDTLPP